METRTRRSRIDYIFYIGSALDATSSAIRDIRDLSNTNGVIPVGNSDDRGVRPSDHNMVETVIAVSAGAAGTTPPSVAITEPSAGDTVSGTIPLSATATDNVGVAGVQFKLGGQNLGTEDTAAPYSVSWNTALVTNGSYVLTAVARDAAGNTAPSGSVTVTVNNTTSAGPLIGHWKLDDGGGTTTADSSGNGAAGTLINNPTWTTGRLGGALSFNGTNRVSIPSQSSWNIASSKYSVAFWVKVYSDGALVAADEYVDGTTSFGTHSLNIGGFGDANRLRSVIDDVRLYTTALTPAEVQALAAGGM